MSRLPIDIEFVRNVAIVPWRAIYKQHMKGGATRHFVLSKSLLSLRGEYMAWLVDEDGVAIVKKETDCGGYESTEKRVFLLRHETDTKREALNCISQYPEDSVNEHEFLELLTQQHQLGGKPFPIFVMHRLYSHTRRSSI